MMTSGMKMMNDNRIVEHKSYETSDGASFTDLGEAQRHQATISYKDDVIGWVERNTVPVYRGTTKLIEDVFPENVNQGVFMLTRSDVADILISYMADLDAQIKAAVESAVTVEIGKRDKG